MLEPSFEQLHFRYEDGSHNAESLMVAPDGTPEGLLFPASTAVSGRYMVVTNLALPLTTAAGDEWEERVTRWNLVRFRLP